MFDSPAIKTVVARLVAEPPPGHLVASRRRLYRPLIMGPALLERTAPGGRWRVRVTRDARLLPVFPAEFASLGRRIAWLRSLGAVHRIAAALVVPQDLAGPPVRMEAADHRLRSEFYGWALMYRLPGSRSSGLIDSNELVPELPAFYESPLELLDRSDFLAARGIPSRPLALVTQPGDFTITADANHRNRFFPQARFCQPPSFEWCG